MSTFYYDEFQYLSFVILAQGIKIKKKRIIIVKPLVELNLIKDIEVFLGFDNYYQHFFKSLSNIAIP